MIQANIDRFKAAVLKSEQSRDAGPLVALFTNTATLDSPAHETPLVGPAGATKFWHDYLDAFSEVRSNFSATHAFGETTALEWISHGVLPTGKSVEYRGVSIVTFAGEKVAAFVTYYDSAQFVADTASPTATATTSNALNSGAANGATSGATNDEGGD